MYKQHINEKKCPILDLRRYKMKRLKDSTIKKYNNHQLLNHLDRLLLLFPIAPYRICDNLIFELKPGLNFESYYFAFSNLDRDRIIDAIETVYLKLNM
jgi:hypothetical protein